MKREHLITFGLASILLVILFLLGCEFKNRFSIEQFKNDGGAHGHSNLSDNEEGTLRDKLKNIQEKLGVSEDSVGGEEDGEHEHGKLIRKTAILPMLREIREDLDRLEKKRDLLLEKREDMSKYILKTEIPSQKKCPEMDNYVLKTNILPRKKCPDCVCPKVNVSAGLCKKCPPPPKCPPCKRCPKPTCPEPKPCPEIRCPIPRPCPPEKKCPKPKSCPPQKVCPAPAPCPSQRQLKCAPCPVLTTTQAPSTCPPIPTTTTTTTIAPTYPPTLPPTRAPVQEEATPTCPSRKCADPLCMPHSDGLLFHPKYPGSSDFDHQRNTNGQANGEPDLSLLETFTGLFKF